MQKFNQLAKDAQSNGDPVLAQNYLQHADHYLRSIMSCPKKKDSLTEKSSGRKNFTQLKEETKIIKKIYKILIRFSILI